MFVLGEKILIFEKSLKHSRARWIKLKMCSHKRKIRFSFTALQYRIAFRSLLSLYLGPLGLRTRTIKLLSQACRVYIADLFYQYDVIKSGCNSTDYWAPARYFAFDDWHLRSNYFFKSRVVPFMKLNLCFAAWNVERIKTFLSLLCLATLQF